MDFLFQSPSLRGSGRFLLLLSCAARAWRRVSIPFIAGQWSLLVLVVFAGAGGSMFQSPSLRGSGRFIILDLLIGFLSSCFNPLHCGAVVASP